MLRLIFALILLSTSVRSAAPGVSTYCEATLLPTTQGLYCATCTQPVFCGVTADGVITTLPMTECQTGYVCQQYPGPTSKCVAMNTAIDCRCSSNICDPYYAGGALAVQCDASGITGYLQCGVASAECALGDCVLCPSTTTVEWTLIYPSCNSGYACFGGEVVDDVQCSESEYVNEEGSCVPAPPTPCTGNCFGNCPDDTDCSQYYICDGTGGVLNTVQCSTGTYFDPDTGKCGTDSSLCSPLSLCTFQSTSGTTTTTSSTTTTTPVACTEDTAGNYPVGPCSSYYWSCRDIGGGIYQNIQQQCQNGQVFSPDSDYPYCVDPDTVDSCAGVTDPPSAPFHVREGGKDGTERRGGL